MSELTNILAAMESGQSQAAAEFLPLVYAELRRLAAWRFHALFDGGEPLPRARSGGFKPLPGDETGDFWDITFALPEQKSILRPPAHSATGPTWTTWKSTSFRGVRVP
jgi:hypothetical protein